MGSDAHVVAVGARPEVLDAAAAELRRFEGLWSRFDPGSEISRLGRLGGPAIVSQETARLIEAAANAWHKTQGRFDPTVGAAMVASGYDASFETLESDGDVPARVECVPGCAGIWAAPACGLVFVPVGVRLDVGGIAKGFAADLVAEQIMSAGARGACVNVGGDLRVIGDSGDDRGWVIAIEFQDTGEVARVELHDGGVATSSTKRRRWRRAGRDLHHVLDPRTGAPTEGDITDAAVVASSAASAEVWAKAILVGGDASHAQTFAGDIALAVIAAGGGEVRCLTEVAA